MKPVTPTCIGLQTKNSCKNSVHKTKVMVPLIAEQFGMIKGIANKIIIQVTLYFKYIGIQNEEIVSLIPESSDLLTPHTYTLEKQPIKSITVPVTLFLSKIENAQCFYRKILCTSFQGLLSKNYIGGIV